MKRNKILDECRKLITPEISNYVESVVGTDKDPLKHELTIYDLTI